eukprot:1633661-Prymnesium_polylepis.1
MGGPRSLCATSLRVAPGAAHAHLGAAEPTPRALTGPGLVRDGSRSNCRFGAYKISSSSSVTVV